MKSKKFVALALSAAMAFSAAYVGVAALSARTPSVSAATVDVKTGSLDYDERYLYNIKLYNTEDKGYDLYTAYQDWAKGGEKYGYKKAGTGTDDDGKEETETPQLTFKALKDILGSKLPTYPNTTIKKFKGWAFDSHDGTLLTDSNFVLTEDGLPVKILEYYNNGRVSNSAKEIKLKDLYTVYQYYDSLQDQEDTLKADAEAAAEKKENDDRNSALSRRQYRQHASNNVKCWWIEQIKDESGKVTGEVVREGTTTAKPRAVLVTGADGKFTPANYRDSSDDKRDSPSESRVLAKKNPNAIIFDKMTAMEYEAAINAARVEDPEHELVYVFDVHWNVNDKVLGLLEGKQAQVTLRLPNLTITNYTPYVYHITYGGKGMMRTAVKNLDVGKHDITFYAQSFSPYVLVLAPGKLERYENPPTADLSAIPTLLLGAAALSATGSTLLRRKRELGE